MTYLEVSFTESPVLKTRGSAFYILRWGFIAGRNSTSYTVPTTYIQSTTTHNACTEVSPRQVASFDARAFTAFLQHGRATLQSLEEQRFFAVPGREMSVISTKVR
ncbi:hypothetical protein AVEN_56165-1 [Araneus ventricosus]|uniref:Uncharacterized protein n=1 Tax=Araneus ventricosus TaxID=182803 RepID=A0A4Y2P809_ARAVE|nr:hypothetical protein AVEN_56165-1 [Araneus ventricosus]